MTSETIKPRGLSRLILQSLQDMASDVVYHGQIIDCHILPALEQQLRQNLVVRPDGSSRLVMDLVLSRSMEEVRQHLGRTLPSSVSRLEASLNSLASV